MLAAVAVAGRAIAVLVAHCSSSRFARPAVEARMRIGAILKIFDAMA